MANVLEKLLRAGEGRIVKKLQQVANAVAALALTSPNGVEAFAPLIPQPPRAVKGAKGRGPGARDASAFLPWLRPEANSARALGPGLLSVFWERGSPDLPACGLRRGSKGGPARPIFTNTNPRPS